MVRVLLMVLFIFPVILLAGQDSIQPNKDARALTSDSSVIYQFRAFSDQAEGVVDLYTLPDAIQQPDPIRQEGIYFARDLSEIRKIIENQRSNATTTPPENTQGIGNQLG